MPEELTGTPPNPNATARPEGIHVPPEVLRTWPGLAACEGTTSREACETGLATEAATIRAAAPSGPGPAADPPAPVVPGILDGLARLPAQALLDERALAAAFRLAGRTIQRMVRRGELPPGVPFAGRTVWLAGKVLAFLEARLAEAAKQAEREAARIRQLCP